jgi:hypothetical protein
MMVGLAANHGEKKTVMIDATYLKAHLTATSMGAKSLDGDAPVTEVLTLGPRAIKEAEPSRYSFGEALFVSLR